MALRRLTPARRAAAAAVLACLWLVVADAASAEAPMKPRPSFRHGLATFVGGLLLEFPKTVAEATFTGPPVVGTAVGLLAGLGRAGRNMIDGTVEMAAGFDPWGTKRSP